MKAAWIVCAAMLATNAGVAGETNTTKGDCSPIIVGNSKSVIITNCNIWPRKERPMRQDALSQIVEGNYFPFYSIDSITFENGFRKGDEEYVVAARMALTLRVSCRQMLALSDPHQSQGVEEIPPDVLRDLAVMLKSSRRMPGMMGKFQDLSTEFGLRMKIALLATQFGGDCKGGEHYTMRVQDRFQNSENGWMLVAHDSVAVTID